MYQVLRSVLLSLGTARRVLYHAYLLFIIIAMVLAEKIEIIMGRKVLRTEEELKNILASGGLTLAEDYNASKSYPNNLYLLTKCRTCNTEAHYRIKYIMEKASSDEPVCRACFWNAWLRASSPIVHITRGSIFSEYSALAQQYGFKLVSVLKDSSINNTYALLLVVCKHCGKQSVAFSSEISCKCSCQIHPSTAAHYAPEVTREVLEPKITYVQKTFLTKQEARNTLCSDVPELLAAWDDERSPYETVVYPTNWSGMYPGDGQYRFKCEHGHHPYAFPDTYLRFGCSVCRGQATRTTGLFLSDTNPEIASEWIREKNGVYTPENIRDNSKRLVWWKCMACNHEWQATPRDRQRKDGQLCPNCGKIQGSIAWIYPRLAEQWDTTNPVSPWCIRPSTKLYFVPLWVCENDHEHTYRASVISRIHGAVCPECTDSRKSRIELKYFDAVRKKIGSARSGARYNYENFSHNWTIDISFNVRGKKFAIEYDGEYWHEGKIDVDKRKSSELLEAGFNVIRIREANLQSLNIKSASYHEIFVRSNYSDFDSNKDRLMACITSIITDKK